MTATKKGPKMSVIAFPNGLGVSVTGTHKGRAWAADVWHSGRVNVFDNDWGGCRATADLTPEQVADPGEAARAVAQGFRGVVTDDWADYLQLLAERRFAAAQRLGS